MQSTYVVLGRLASEDPLGYCMAGSQFLFVWVLAASPLTHPQYTEAEVFGLLVLLMGLLPLRCPTVGLIPKGE